MTLTFDLWPPKLMGVLGSSCTNMRSSLRWIPPVFFSLQCRQTNIHTDTAKNPTHAQTIVGVGNEGEREKPSKWWWSKQNIFTGRCYETFPSIQSVFVTWICEGWHQQPDLAVWGLAGIGFLPRGVKGSSTPNGRYEGWEVTKPPMFALTWYSEYSAYT